jgi:hypothetical protein
MASFEDRKYLQKEDFQAIKKVGKSLSRSSLKKGQNAWWSILGG